MALGRMHVGASPLESCVRVGIGLGALGRRALPVLAIHRHRSSKSSKAAFIPAYHLTTE
jgi:hypothetical protein